MDLLLDTHVLLWLYDRQPLRSHATDVIEQALRTDRLFVSDILAWEVATAFQSKSIHRRPNLGGLQPRPWLQQMTETYSLQWLRITHEVALEAAEVPALYGPGDPGDCFLIATARLHSLNLVTRDERILALASEQPGYLATLAC